METIEEFMQKYFAERKELMCRWLESGAFFLREFFTKDYLLAHDTIWSQDLEQEKTQTPVVLIHADANSAKVIAYEHGYNSQKQRYQYHLIATEAGWQINQKGAECFACNGSGWTNCESCGGLGWIYGYHDD